MTYFRNCMVSLPEKDSLTLYNTIGPIVEQKRAENQGVLGKSHVLIYLIYTTTLNKIVYR